jgi:DNA-directed RNA polymerase sigma subunit (sigma70/sigma32)
MVIMHDRFGFQGEPKTLREAGAPWKIGPERARQIEARALQYVWKALQISKAELHEMIARRNALRELLRIE